MKRISALSAQLLVFFLNHAQTSPYMGTITVLPQTITTSDQVSIITTLTTSTFGTKISTSHAVNHGAKIISLYGCYAESMLTALRPYQDTFNIGTLLPGIYTIIFTAFESSSTQSCVAVRSNSIGASLTVSAVTDLQERTDEYALRIFPSPGHGEFIVESERMLKDGMVFLSNSSGQVVKEYNQMAGFSITLPVDDLPEGIYFIAVCEGKNLLVSKKIILSRR